MKRFFSLFFIICGLIGGSFALSLYARDSHDSSESVSNYIYCEITDSTAWHIDRFLDNVPTTTRAQGMIPDAETAVKIAEALCYPIYGEKTYKNLPFQVCYYEERDCWFVYGTMPENTLGGTIEVFLQKSDGKVLLVTHTQ